MCVLWFFSVCLERRPFVVDKSGGVFSFDRARNTVQIYTCKKNDTDQMKARLPSDSSWMKEAFLRIKATVCLSSLRSADSTPM